MASSTAPLGSPTMLLSSSCLMGCCNQVVATEAVVEPCCIVVVAAQPLILMLMMLSVGHLLLIDVDDEGCILWAQLLDVVAAAQLLLSLLLSISTSMLGSSLYCLSLMTNDEPDGGSWRIAQSR